MSEDLIKRSDAIKEMEQRYQDILRIFKRKVKDGEKAIALDMIGCIKTLPSADRPSAVDLSSVYSTAYKSGYEKGKADRPQGEWIPVKWHEITDEEREREGYPKDWVVHIDCEMPCDEQEILVQTKSGYVRWDVCYEDGEFSLDSGWDWIEDIVAWMPLPEPWKGADDE